MQNATGGVSFDGLKRTDIVYPEISKETPMCTSGKIRQLSDNFDGPVRIDELMLTPPSSSEVNIDIC
jgi:hypothetical protein